MKVKRAGLGNRGVSTTCVHTIDVVCHLNPQLQLRSFSCTKDHILKLSIVLSYRHFNFHKPRIQFIIFLFKSIFIVVSLVIWMTCQVIQLVKKRSLGLCGFLLSLALHVIKQSQGLQDSCHVVLVYPFSSFPSILSKVTLELLGIFSSYLTCPQYIFLIDVLQILPT